MTAETWEEDLFTCSSVHFTCSTSKWHPVSRAPSGRDDATVTPLGATVCETVTVARRDLCAGTELDGIGRLQTEQALMFDSLKRPTYTHFQTSRQA